MSVQIDMTNYEAFYLDYLEGNLSGDALAAFEAFLSEHPELAIDNEPLPKLEAETVSYDPIQKLALKKSIDLNDLNGETIEFFLIAREEGLLNSDQKAQLNHWLEANAHYRQDADVYALVQLEADTTEVFEHKSTLRKTGGGRIIPMWWTGAAVAAGLALLITIGLSTGGTETNDPANGGLSAANKKPVPTEQVDPKNGGNNASTGTDANPEIKPRKNAGSNNQQQKRTNGSEQPKTPVKPRRPAYQPNNPLLRETVLASLEKRNATLHTGNKTVEPMPAIAPQPQTHPVKNEAPQSDMAWVPVDQMKNPIQPVTQTLSNTLNTPVDFRTAKASKRKGGGFYLKIGKLQVSHQPGQSASLY